MLFKIQRELIDIDRQQYLKPDHDSRTRGKTRFAGKKPDSLNECILVPLENFAQCRATQQQLSPLYTI
jgi:hypothetical protein